MNEGVKILLERMKTNPDEFIDGLGIRMSKWGSLIAQFREYLDKADIEAIEEAYKPLMQQHFTEQIMKELLDPEEDDGLGKWYTKQSGMPLGGVIPSVSLNSGAVSGTVSVGGTWGDSPYATSATINANSLTLGNTTINEKTLKHLQAHKTYLDAQKQKKHTTLFGKLFNYS
jgi:hypothetical protein